MIREVGQLAVEAEKALPLGVHVHRARSHQSLYHLGVRRFEDPSGFVEFLDYFETCEESRGLAWDSLPKSYAILLLSEKKESKGQRKPHSLPGILSSQMQLYEL